MAISDWMVPHLLARGNHLWTSLTADTPVSVSEAGGRVGGVEERGGRVGGVEGKMAYDGLRNLPWFLFSRMDNDLRNVQNFIHCKI